MSSRFNINKERALQKATITKRFLKIRNLKKKKKLGWVSFLEDPIFNSYIFDRFICSFMTHGKKDKIYKIMYSLFGGSKNSPINIEHFFLLLERKKFLYVIKNIRVGRNIYEVPKLILGLGSSYRKTIFYIRKAIEDRRGEKNLKIRVFNEFDAMLREKGYENPYLKRNKKVLKDNWHLKRFFSRA